MKPCITNKPRRRSSARSAAEAKNNPIAAQDIARLAHSYWEARGGSGGSPEEDWLRAEREITARGTSQTSAAAA